MTQPGEEVIKRTTFAMKTGEILTGEAQTCTLAPVKPSYSKPMAQLMGTEEGLLPRYADTFGAMARRVEGGVSVAQAMHECAALMPPNEAKALAAAAFLIAEGTPISRAIPLQGKTLHPMIAPILEVSERAGRSEWAMRQCEAAFRRLQTAERKLDWAVLHPLIVKNVRIDLAVCGVSLAVLCLLFPFLTPVFVGAYGLTFGGIALLRKRLLKNDPAKWGRFLLKTPGQGDVTQNFAGATWLRSLAILWGAGVPISVALETAGEMSGNPHYRQILNNAANSTRRGETLSSALEKTKLLPSRLIDFVKTAEITGDMDGLLASHADYLTDEAKQSAAQWFGLMFIIFKALIGAMIVYVFGGTLGASGGRLDIVRLGTGIYVLVCIPTVYALWLKSLDRKRK